MAGHRPGAAGLPSEREADPMISSLRRLQLLAVRVIASHWNTFGGGKRPGTLHTHLDKGGGTAANNHASFISANSLVAHRGASRTIPCSKVHHKSKPNFRNPLSMKYSDHRQPGAAAFSRA